MPTLPKASLVEQWDRIVTARRLRLADVEAHAAGPAAAERYRDEFRVVSTSGSSGLRGLFVYGPAAKLKLVKSMLNEPAPAPTG